MTHFLMNALARASTYGQTRLQPRRWSRVTAFGALLTAGCDQAFEPYQDNETAVFSMFGSLDLYADTQWIRVMPVRQAALLTAEPLDAVVTLQHVGSGKTVALSDSLFSFGDVSLGASAYAHNFWTTEKLEPGATYRLKAVRADGRSSEAQTTLPGEINLTFENNMRLLLGSSSTLVAQAENVVSVEVLHLMNLATNPECPGGPRGVVRAELQRRLARAGLGQSFQVSGLIAYGACLEDARRQEVRVTATTGEWPYRPDLSDLDVARPGTATSNIENGLGFVAGLAVREIPYHRCQQITPRPLTSRTCLFTYDGNSASISGVVMSQPCGRPHALADVRLTERYLGGGTVIRHWKTGYDGEYRFEGIEPGTDLTLDVRPIEPELLYHRAGAGSSASSSVVATAAPMVLPRLGAGQRYTVPTITVSNGC